MCCTGHCGLQGSIVHVSMCSWPACVVEVWCRYAWEHMLRCTALHAAGSSQMRYSSSGALAGCACTSAAVPAVEVMAGQVQPGRMLATSPAL